jgi:tetratricopeptide (TPR) repeat protein
MKSWACAACMLMTLLGTSRADTIHLKDGTSVSATNITEKDGQVQYSAGGAQHSVPKSSVSSIEHGESFGLTIGTSKNGWIAPSKDSGPSHLVSGDTPGSTSGSTSKVSRSQLAATLPKEPQMRGVDSAALTAKVVNSNGINERALHEIEADGNSAQTAEAYLIASRYAYDHSDGEAARSYMQRCIGFAPDQAPLLEWYSILLLDSGLHQEAVTQAERAVQRAPYSAEARQVLGMADYDSGRFSDAIENWKRAQEIHPSEFVAAYLEKAEREAKVEGKFSEREGMHFVLRYEGREAGITFASELLSTLERQYMELQRDLGFAPNITITVILYTEQQFFDVTKVPSWCGGVNDGKIRVAVHDLSNVTPQLEEVLRHEMAHSFVHSATHGRCPAWLNEGIAQMEEPRSSSAFAGHLARLFHDGTQAPLRNLEGSSFLGLSPAQAQLAYAESLAATEYLRTNCGMYAIRRMLELLNDGEAPEAALNHAVHANYADFENGLGSYLARNSH